MRENEEVLKFPVESLNGKLVLVKVGNSDRPASADDLEDMKKQWEDALNNSEVDCTVIITHHAVDVDVLGGKDFKKFVSVLGENKNRRLIS